MSDQLKQDKTRQKVYLAALLHDIGKFYQRAEGKPAKKLEEEVRKLAGAVCPVNQKGSFGYQHVLYTLKFFNEHKDDVFERVRDQGRQLFNNNIFYPKEDDITDNLVNLSIYHHNPQSELQSLIQLADFWSSGVDRTRDDTLETDQEASDEEIDWGSYPYRKIPLSPVFNDLLLDCRKNPECWGYHLQKLDINQRNSIFPQKWTQEKVEQLPNEYSNHWKNFNNEFKQIPNDSYEAFTESLLYLLQSYCWCIPSSTKDMSNASLYEHLKTTGAIAQCLYDYKQKHNNHFEFNSSTKRLPIKKEFEGDRVTPLLMVCGDLSGIQTFIYDIHSRKAATSLKGRSFYLELLTETIIQRIITDDAIQANIGHVLSSSGGKFYMLLPNTNDVVKALSSIHREIEKQMWDIHNGRIYLSIDWTPFQYIPGNKEQEAEILLNKDDENTILTEKSNKSPYCVDNWFNNEADKENYIHKWQRAVHLGDLWKLTTDKAAKWKSRKFQYLMENDDYFEEIFGKGLNVKDEGIDLAAPGIGKTTCAVTGEIIEQKDENLLEKTEDTENEKIWVKPEVKQQVILGKHLRQADYLITFRNPSVEGLKHIHNKLFNINPLNLGIHHYFFQEDELTFEDTDFHKISSADTSRVKQINKTGFLQSNKLKGKDASYGYLFYGGNEQALISHDDEDRIKTFDELAGRSDLPFRRLGVLRMDVDNLGQLITNGFPDKEKTFATYATLSFELNLFFSGYINTLREENEKDDNDKKYYKDHMNILYSGGDDMFIIGKWDKVIEFAYEIRQSFHEFICERNRFSISGGLVLVPPKYPIQRAANIAGEAEKAAKKWSSSEYESQPSKNAINIFGINVSWEDEFVFVRRWKDYFLTWIGEQKIRNGLLFKLYDYYRLQQDNEPKWQWLSVYHLARHKNADNKEEIEKLRKTILCGDTEDNINVGAERALRLLCVAARWTEFLLREEQ